MRCIYNKPNVSMVIFLQKKSVSMCSVQPIWQLLSSQGPFLHHIPSLGCSAPSGWRKLLAPAVGLDQNFPGAAAGQKSQEWQETPGRVQAGRQLPAGVAWRAQGGTEELWQHKGKGTCTVTWRGKRALLGWQEQAQEEHRSSEHSSTNEDASAGIQRASDEVVW